MTESSKSLLISSDKFEPAYMELFRTGELYRRSRQALRHLENCKVCPRDCEVNRCPTSSEIVKAKTIACQKGLHRFDKRSA